MILRFPTPFFLQKVAAKPRPLVQVEGNISRAAYKPFWREDWMYTGEDWQAASGILSSISLLKSLELLDYNLYRLPSSSSTPEFKGETEQRWCLEQFQIRKMINSICISLPWGSSLPFFLNPTGWCGTELDFTPNLKHISKHINDAPRTRAHRTKVTHHLRNTTAPKTNHKETNRITYSIWKLLE